MVISVLISLDQELSENIWFVWLKTSYSGDVTDAGRRRRTTTSEDRATQLLICEALSLAIIEQVMGPFSVHYNKAQFVENCVGSNTNVKVILYEIYKL